MAVEALSEESFPVIEAETEKRLCALLVSIPPTSCRLPMCVSLAPSTLRTSPNAAARQIGPFPEIYTNGHSHVRARPVSGSI